MTTAESLGPLHAQRVGLSLRCCPQWRTKQSGGWVASVYVIGIEGQAVVKIGIAEDPERRLARLQTAHHDRLYLLAVIPTDEARTLEAELHERFASSRRRGEWFEITPELRAWLADQRGELVSLSAWVTVRKLKSGERFRVMYRIGGRKGKPRYGGSFHSREDAQERVEVIRSRHAAGVFPGAASGAP